MGEKERQDCVEHENGPQEDADPFTPDPEVKQIKRHQQVVAKETPQRPGAAESLGTGPAGQPQGE
jgi:hypothetical protein